MDEDDLAYVAGYLDGEGCFVVTKRWKIAIACENTHRPTMEWLQRMFGGSLTTTKPKKANHRVTHRWCVVGRVAYRACVLLVPFLREKQGQAALLMAMQQTVTDGGRIPPEVLEERQFLTKLVTEKKGRIRVAA